MNSKPTRAKPVVVMAALLLAALAGCQGCRSGVVVSEGESTDPKAVAAEDDRIAEQEVSASDKAEARSWLRDPSHVIFEGSKETAVKLVDDLYNAGAVEVWVTGIAELADAKLTASLVAVLPADPEARRKVFEVEAAFKREIEEEPASDVGQKYLRFIFD